MKFQRPSELKRSSIIPLPPYLPYKNKILLLFQYPFIKLCQSQHATFDIDSVECLPESKFLGKIIDRKLSFEGLIVGFGKKYPDCYDVRVTCSELVQAIGI